VAVHNASIVFLPPAAVPAMHHRCGVHGEGFSDAQVFYYVERISNRNVLRRHEFIIGKRTAKQSIDLLEYIVRINQSHVFSPPAQAGQNCYLGHTSLEVIEMSYVNPALRPKFETLPIDLKNEILARDVTLSDLNDLIHVLQEIVDEAKAAP